MAWAGWRSAHLEKRLKRSKVQKAVKVWKNSFVGKSHRSWCLMVAEKKRKGSLAAKCIGRFKYGAEARAWARWFEMRYERKRMRKAVSKAANMWKNSFLARSWRTWYRNSLMLCRLRMLTRRVLLRWKNKVLGEAFNKWHHELVRTRKARRASMMWTNHLNTRAFRKWETFVRDRQHVRLVAQRALGRWVHRLLARCWDCWYDEHVKLARLESLSARTRRTLYRWVNTVLSKAFDKWWEELVRTRKLKKSFKFWVNHAKGMVWRTWCLRVKQGKHLKGVLTKALRRWRNRCLSQAWQKWWKEVRRKRIVRRTIASFTRKSLCKALRTWCEEPVAGAEDVCSCTRGVCPLCDRNFKEWDDAWDQAMDEHERIERELLVTAQPGGIDQGGFVGLQVTESPPHHVQAVDDLVDENFIRHDAPGYTNPPINVGDRILHVDGMHVENVSLGMLQSMLKGPMHSTVRLSFARADSGDRYTVLALRHGFRTFEQQRTASSHIDGGYGYQPLSSLLKESLYNTSRSSLDLYSSHHTSSEYSLLYNSRLSGADDMQGRSTPVSNPALDVTRDITGMVSSPTVGYSAPSSLEKELKDYPMHDACALSSAVPQGGVVASNKAPTTRLST